MSPIQVTPSPVATPACTSGPDPWRTVSAIFVALFFLLLLASGAGLCYLYRRATSPGTPGRPWKTGEEEVHWKGTLDPDPEAVPRDCEGVHRPPAVHHHPGSAQQGFELSELRGTGPAGGMSVVGDGSRDAFCSVDIGEDGDEDESGRPVSPAEFSDFL